MKKITNLVLILLISISMLSVLNACSSQLNVKSEEELAKAKKEREIMYSHIKTPFDAAELYDSREYELTWDRTETGIPIPPKEASFACGTCVDGARSYMFPFKVKGELYMIYYRRNANGDPISQTIPRIVCTMEPRDGYNEEIVKTWTLDQDWTTEVKGLPVEHEKTIITGRVTEPMWNILAKTNVYDKWAKEVDAKNEEALKKILAKQEQ